MSEHLCDSPELFLKHAEMLVEESLEHYRQLADSMALHHNHEAAGLFRQLAELMQQQEQHLRQLCAGRELPRLAPWEYRWHCPGAPGQDCLQQARYLMHPHQALRLAIHNEEHARQYYQAHATAGDPEIRWLADVLSAAQEVLIERLSLWLDLLESDGAQTPVDTDPPNLPG